MDGFATGIISRWLTEDGAEVCLAFYRGPGDWITWLIRLVTFGPFSHVELVFSDGVGFSASGRDGCVRFSRVEGLEDEKRWALVPLEISREDELRLRVFCRRYLRLPFDWNGVLSFLLPWKRSDRGRWYCTELVLLVLQQELGLFIDVHRRLSPNDLYRELQWLIENRKSEFLRAA